MWQPASCASFIHPTAQKRKKIAEAGTSIFCYKIIPSGTHVDLAKARDSARHKEIICFSYSARI